MRDRLVHAYFDVNLDILWTTVTGDLPPLARALGYRFVQVSYLLERTGELP